jgi:hypothetical protein
MGHLLFALAHCWRGENAMPSNEQAAAKQSQTPNVDKLPDNVKAQAVDAARPSVQLMERTAAATEKAQPLPSGRGDTPEALIRNQGDQGKEQSAMSPTDSSKSQSATQQRTMNRSRGMER